MYDLTKIFKIKEEDDNQIIIELINNDDPLIVAKYPFIDSTIKYITITKGSVHNVVVVHHDGTTFDFYFGLGGYTIISEHTKMLKDNILKFLDNNKISIE